MTNSIFETAVTMQSLRAQHIVTERDRQFTLQLSRLFQVGEDGHPTAEPVRFTAGTETHGIIFIEGSGATRPLQSSTCCDTSNPCPRTPKPARRDTSI